MTATNQPFGLRPVYSQQGFGGSRGRAFYSSIPSGYATNIFMQTPVRLATGGTINPVNATSNDFIGAFQGCEFVDTLGRWRESNYWPASTTIGSGATTPTMIAYVTDDPNEVYEIQCDGTLTGSQGSALGRELNFNSTDITTGTPAGNTITGLSSCRAAGGAPIATGTQGQLMVIDKGMQVDNDWTDAYPIVRVRIATHQYVANKQGIA